MKSKLCIGFWIVFACFNGFAQEINATFVFNFQGMQPGDKIILDQLKTSIESFTNTRKWTNDNYKPVERVTCTFQFLIDKYENNRFQCKNLIFAVSRPVYHSGYNTTVLNVQDEDVSFEYTMGQNLDFNETQFNTNITSLVGFYVYMALGIDRDSFAPLGGTSMYERARNVVNSAQSANAEKGWKSGESVSRRNRYWLVDQLLDNAYKELRNGFYEYHLQGLDKMADEGTAAGREGIIKCLDKYYAVNQARPGTYVIFAFFDAKQIELVNVFKNAEPAEQNTFLEKMGRLDPINLPKYNKIKEK